VAAECDRAAKETKEPALKELLVRIRGHELYHVDIFNDLLKREEGRGKKR
jgi:rubrerythrin